MKEDARIKTQDTRIKTQDTGEDGKSNELAIGKEQLAKLARIF